MKKLTALLLCLVLCVSMFAACGGDEPADTTGTAPTTTKPVEGDETTGPVTPGTDDTTNGDTTTEGGSSGPTDPTVDLSDLLPEYADSEKVEIEDLGAVDAGEVASDYATFLEDAVGIATLADIGDPYGTYYLTADIEANTTTVTEFYGVLDGCGHTVTTSVPLFGELGGGIINLTLAGEIALSDESGAALANHVVSETTVFNVKNTCNITVSASSSVSAVYAAGFAATLDGEDIVFANCEYSGTITNEFTQLGNNKRVTAGLVAMIAGELEDYPPIVDFLNCTVSGTISATSNVGGIVGEAVAPVTLGIYGSVNNAEIKTTRAGASAGGVIGAISGGSGSISLANCLNDGVITSVQNAGGIVGGQLSTGSLSMFNVMWCTNKKDITSGNCIGGIVGVTRKLVTITECVNFGNLTAVLSTDEGAAKYSNFMGGIIGAENSGSLSCEYTRCVNYGDIRAVRTPAHLGGIAGNHDGVPGVFKECVNFGKISSTYYTPKSKTGEHRIGGICGGGNSYYELYECVNFGDITSTMGHGGQPLGGIVGCVNTGGGALVVVNCMNYGDLDNATKLENGTLVGFTVSGIAGWVIGTGGVTIKGCINAGMLSSNRVCADITSWHQASTLLKEPSLDIENNYYVPGRYIGGLDQVVYAPFVQGDGKDTDTKEYLKTAASYTKFSEAAVKVQVSDFANETSDGLAAKMSEKSGDTTFKSVKVVMNDGVETMTVIVPETVIAIITDRIVTAE